MHCTEFVYGLHYTNISHMNVINLSIAKKTLNINYCNIVVLSGCFFMKSQNYVRSTDIVWVISGCFCSYSSMKFCGLYNYFECVI